LTSTNYSPPKKLSIIIPVFNERNTIENVVETVSAVSIPLEKEIIIVDDFSTDGTRELLPAIESKSAGRVRVLLHEKNHGKGYAIRTGMAQVTGDLVLVQDADLEYDPQDYPVLLAPVLAGRADVVFGNRFHGGQHRVLYFWHFQINQFLTFLSNLLTNLNLSDMEVGYKLFRREIIQNIKLTSNRFGFEPEVTIKAARQKCRIYEVPISYHGRTYEEGKKITWKDGVAALYFLFKYSIFG
jgi:glycosyltransferase involved in cell wall biosynthesis